MTLPQHKIDELVALIQREYPGWSGFEDPRFIEDEIGYKRAAVSEAGMSLSRAELEQLYAEGRFDEFVDRLDTIGKMTNLLWLSVPREGDLGILMQPELDRPSFCSAMIDLLYGPGPSQARLERHVQYLDAHGLRNKWVFPTYFLFVCHPDTEMLIKPRTIQWFLEFVGGPKFTDGPAVPSLYAAIKEIVHQLRDALQPYGARDMVDIQSLIWVCYSASQDSQQDLDANRKVSTAPAIDKPTTIAEPGVPYIPDVEATEGCPFSKRTFELLAGLHQNPTKELYQAHKDEFHLRLEVPFQQLFRAVAAQLPAPITSAMETDRRVFGRILKNDYGQGGAWSFYWGAFYPKGGKRIEDAQLSMWINHQYFEVGFYIGEYGSTQRQRFARNCQEHHATLIDLLRESLSDERLLRGGREDMDVRPDGAVTSRIDLTWQEWLRDPAQANFDLSRVWSANQVLAYDAQALIGEIVEMYMRLFPLVLLTISDDPIPAIVEYLGLEELDEEPELNPSYSLAQCAQETGFDEVTLSRWVRAIHRKGQAILYGPPGTGKTYVAEHLAKHLVGGGDGFVELVQFHPAYAYEDFMQGIRPQERKDGGLSYPTVPGRFLQFCGEAGHRQGYCVLIIDEINRANLARVFGEMMYLLEYRDQKIPLAGGNSFSIPENVRIMGTMNTADRSIALVDHALRRRFAFLRLGPNYEILKHYHQQTGFNVTPLIAVLGRLNRQIGDPHYEVGITFFLQEDLADQIADIWQMEVEPYLEEYFFDQPDKVDEYRWKQVGNEILGTP